MIREIKFRGKCLNSGEWAYGVPLESKFNCVYMLSKKGGLNADFINSRYTILDSKDSIPTDKNTIGQFTGLKDKNGVDIYEGDIVKDDYSRVLEITYWNYRLCFYALSETNFKIADFYDWLPINSMLNKEFPVQKIEVEVIGNIHEK